MTALCSLLTSDCWRRRNGSPLPTRLVHNGRPETACSGRQQVLRPLRKGICLICCSRCCVLPVPLGGPAARRPSWLETFWPVLRLIRHSL